MEFRNLEYIVGVAKYGSVSQVAEQLFVSQSTISKSIKKTEEELGLQLFSRIGNRLELTYAGKRYVTLAKDVLIQKKTLERGMQELLSTKVGSLSIAFPPVRSTYMLPRILPEFHRQYPNVELNVQEAPSSEIDSMLLSGEVDLAFYNFIKSDNRLCYEVLNSEEIVLIVSADHPLANQEIPRTTKDGRTHNWINLNAFENDLFLVQPTTHRMGIISGKLFELTNFYPSHTMLIKNIIAAVNLAAAGYGVCIVSEAHLNHITITNHYRYFSIGFSCPCFRSNFVYAYRKGNELPKYAADFVEIVRKNIHLF